LGGNKGTKEKEPLFTLEKKSKRRGHVWWGPLWSSKGKPGWRKNGKSTAALPAYAVEEKRGPGLGLAEVGKKGGKGCHNAVPHDQFGCQKRKKKKKARGWITVIKLNKRGKGSKKGKAPSKVLKYLNTGIGRQE